MTYYFTARAKADIEICCCLCLKFIRPGVLYVRATSGKVAHYKCAKSHGWKRESRKKRPVKTVPRERVDKSIKLVRCGKVIKRVDP